MTLETIKTIHNDIGDFVMELKECKPIELSILATESIQQSK